MLQTRQVAFQYPSHGGGLKPVSVAFPEASISLVTGRSGSGKSTLARCLTGLIPHLYHGNYSGEVWLGDHLTVNIPMWKLSEKVGMVLQNPRAQMLAPSVEEEIVFGLENLGLERDEITHRLEAVLSQFDLLEMRNRSPLSLSGGEQQKLALAAIVAREPKFLVLDEPLSMLDTTSADGLIGYLDRISKKGTTVSIFEHRQEYLDEIKKLRIIELNGSSRQSNYQSSLLNLPQSEPTRLVMENIDVRLGDRPVIHDFGLTLEGGQLVAVVGRNGVGKTTLLRSIAGFQKYSGKIYMSTPNGDRPPDMGIVFQNPDLQLFNPTAKEEILYKIVDPDLGYYSALVSALGLKPYEGTPPLLLSEGEKKRLALALVMMQRPVDGLLLDEPSLGQDDVHKKILTGLLHSLTRVGQLVIMTTHDLILASQADRIILLGQRGVIVNGAASDVLKDKAAWKAAGIHLPKWFVKAQSQRIYHEN